MNEGKGYPISETELGAWNVTQYDYDSYGNKSAFFHPINSSYYDNILSKNGKNYKITTFEEFKKVFTIPLGNNYFRTEQTIKRNYSDEDPYGEEEWDK